MDFFMNGRKWQLGYIILILRFLKSFEQELQVEAKWIPTFN
jgi:hypothetical protein